MRNLYDSGISIEQMAAYLDGNLSKDEMNSMSSIIDKDATLKQFVDRSHSIDETIDSIYSSDFELPSELRTNNFQIPSLDGEDLSNIVTFTPDPTDETMLAAAACAATAVNHDVHGIIDESASGRYNPFDHSSEYGHVHPGVLHHPNDHTGTIGYDEDSIGTMGHDDGIGGF